jgi:hypothetical protein
MHRCIIEPGRVNKHRCPSGKDFRVFPQFMTILLDLLGTGRQSMPDWRYLGLDD